MSRLSWIEKKKQPAFEIFLIEFNFNAFQITWKLWVIIFGSVLFLSKKVTKPKFLKKKNRNRVKPTGFGSVRFFMEKTGSNRFGSVFLGFGSVFSVFPVWLGFFLGFFQFRFGSGFSVFFL
jgi:hypothetical protein